MALVQAAPYAYAALDGANKLYKYYNTAKDTINTVNKYSNQAANLYNDAQGTYKLAKGTYNNLKQNVKTLTGTGKKRKISQISNGNSARSRGPPPRGPLIRYQIPQLRHAGSGAGKSYDRFLIKFKKSKEIKAAKVYSGRSTFQDQGSFFLHCRVGMEHWQSIAGQLQNMLEYTSRMNRSTVRWLESTNAYTAEMTDPMAGSLDAFYQRKFLHEKDIMTFNFKNQASGPVYMTYWVIHSRNTTTNAAGSNAQEWPLDNIMEDYRDSHLMGAGAVHDNPVNITNGSGAECDATIGSLKMNGDSFRRNYKIAHKKTVRLLEGGEHTFCINQQLNLLLNMAPHKDWMKGITKFFLFKTHGSIGDTVQGFSSLTGPPTGSITTGRAKIICTWNRTSTYRIVMTTPSIKFKPDTDLLRDEEGADVPAVYEMDDQDGDIDNIAVTAG